VFLYAKALDRSTYERQRDKVRGDVAQEETEMEKTNGQELDVESTLSFAEHLMMNVVEMWTEATPGQKLRLQDTLFPEGLVFAGEEF